MPNAATLERDAHPKGTADPRKLLSVEDVCRTLGINKHTFYAYRKKYASFRTVKVGNRTYMRPERLDSFLKELEEEQA